MSEEIHFIKMEGAGNDYVYVDCFSQMVLNPQAFTRRVSDRHFGIGSDGVIFIKPSKRADCFMDIYNADGSRGRTCGNGLRCVAMYMWELSGETAEEVTIETLSGICRARVMRKNGRKCWVSVTMGKAFCRAVTVPRHEISRLLPGGVFVDWIKIVDTGNLHCVVMLKCFDKSSCPEEVLASVDLFSMGRFLENYKGFPGSVNVELCMSRDCDGYISDDLELDAVSRFGAEDALPLKAFCVRIWERGSQETLACGSGACAVFEAAADIARRAEESLTQCCVFMPGGRLAVASVDGQLVLSGDAARVFEGCVRW